MKYIITEKQYNLIKESLDEDIMREMTSMYGHPVFDGISVESEDGKLIGFYTDGGFWVIPNEGQIFVDRYSILPKDVSSLFKNWVDSYLSN